MTRNATALVISVVTHVPVTWAVVIIGAAMIVYTVRGGAAAVIWTDVVQLFVYLAGAAVVFVSLLALIPGGWPEVLRAGSAAGKFRVFDFSTTLVRPYTFWAGVIGGIGTVLGKCNVNIAGMHLGRERQGGRALALLLVDDPVRTEVIEQVRKLANILSAKVVRV